MPKRFRLETVGRVRRIIEERKQREFAEVTRDVARARGEWTALDDELHAAQEAYNQVAERAVGIATLRLREGYLIHLMQRRRAASLRLEAELRRQADKREELIAATRDREVVDRLHERHDEREAREERRADEKRLAETALSRYLQRDESV